MHTLGKSSLGSVLLLFCYCYAHGLSPCPGEYSCHIIRRIIETNSSDLMLLLSGL